MNKMMKNKRLGTLVGILCVAAGAAAFFVFGAGFCMAEAPDAGPAVQAASTDKASFADRKAALLKLKNEDPEKFKALVAQKREALKERLSRLKETDPQKYQQVMSQLKQRKLAALKHLKETNPEAFKKIVDARKEKLQEKLAALKERDPERYQKLMHYKGQLTKLREMRKNNPEEFKKFMEEHPQLKERLRDQKQRFLHKKTGSHVKNEE